MKISLKLLLPLLILAPFFLSLGGCGCGFSCSGGGNDDNNPTELTLGFSDSLPEDLTEVVIKVNSITFRRPGAEDVKVESFTLRIGNEEFLDVSDFQVNLLDYRGLSQLTVIEDLELDTGLYSEVSIEILDGNISNSYVMEEGSDTQSELNVRGESLDLKDLRLSSGSQQVTVEFGLAQALEFQSSDSSYLLTTTGIRMENNQAAASLSGEIDSALFDFVSPCREKVDPEKGNRVYLYEGKDLLSGSLADVFTADSLIPPPDDVIAPFAVASIEFISFNRTWQYSFGFIPAGDYTMAFACDTETDNSIEYNELTIPLPDNQVYEITLNEGDKFQCNISESIDCTANL